jgi:hypothetical protein
MTTFTEVIEYVLKKPRMIGIENPLLHSHLTSNSLFLKYASARDECSAEAACVSDANTPEKTIDILQILACFYEEC